MIARTISVCGKAVTLGVSALLPKIYRTYYGRDIVQDIKNLQKNIEDETDLTAMDLTRFERIAWTMAYHADEENVPKNSDEWLKSFDGILSIQDVFPIIFEMFGLTPNENLS